MTQLGLREQKKQRTHRELRAAAMQLFAEKGYQATTVDDIAARAGVSARTFFRYFETKADAVFSKEPVHRAALMRMTHQHAADRLELRALRPALLEWADDISEDSADLAETTGLIEQESELTAHAMLRRTEWEHDISSELARVLGETAAGERAVLLARLAMTAVTHALFQWANGGSPTEELSGVLARTLDGIHELA